MATQRIFISKREDEKKESTYYKKKMAGRPALKLGQTANMGDGYFLGFLAETCSYVGGLNFFEPTIGGSRRCNNLITI